MHMCTVRRRPLGSWGERPLFPVQHTIFLFLPKGTISVYSSSLAVVCHASVHPSHTVARDSLLPCAVLNGKAKENGEN